MGNYSAAIKKRITEFTERKRDHRGLISQRIYSVLSPFLCGLCDSLFANSPQNDDCAAANATGPGWRRDNVATARDPGSSGKLLLPCFDAWGDEADVVDFG